MINYGKVKSMNSPSAVEITPNYVYVASNIETHTREIDGVEETFYEYDYVSYTKDEYISVLSVANAAAIEELTDELAATKILLGVE